MPTLQAGDEAIMEGFQLKLAGAHSLGESLLAACTSGQLNIAPHLHQPLIQTPLHFIHDSIARLKLILQAKVRNGVCSVNLHQVQCILAYLCTNDSVGCVYVS